MFRTTYWLQALLKEVLHRTVNIQIKLLTSEALIHIHIILDLWITQDGCRRVILSPMTNNIIQHSELSESLIEVLNMGWGKMSHLFGVLGLISTESISTMERV
jgi:hypothetical protein